MKFHWANVIKIKYIKIKFCRKKLNQLLINQKILKAQNKNMLYPRHFVQTKGS